jgi:UDP-N-acetylmuramoyl-tripeptide--D-alanyl-D-alanine ligase
MTLDQLYTKIQACTRPVIDSRQVEAGDLFIALRGSRSDGNQYARAALRAGARYALVDDPGLKGTEGMLWVEDALATLQALARHHRRRFSIPIVGITGSNGKTTTKELVRDVLARRYRVHATAGNLNNHIGVPLTLIGMNRETDIAIVEMGANHQGEIDLLSRIAEPTHGLITNIGKAHLEGFGGIEGVKKGKSELYRYLAETGGVGFVNREEKFLEELSIPVARRIFYQRPRATGEEGQRYQIALRSEKPHLQVRFWDIRSHAFRASIQLTGVHNWGNIATAVALGQYFKVPERDIAEALETYVPQNNRSEWRELAGNRFFLDAYNANPTSMRHALDGFCRHSPTPRMALLGAMFELGPYSEQEHDQMAAFVAELPLDEVVLVGQAFAPAAKRYGLTFLNGVADLIEWFEARNPSGFHIFLKGSRGMRMDQLIEHLDPATS